MDVSYLFFILLFLVAFLYSSVGHGGASGYLALMVLFSFTTDMLKPAALLLNICVSLVSFIQFYRAGCFNWKIFIPLAVGSIPFAFVGGLVVVDGEVYKKVLGILLLIPVIRFFFFKTNITHTKPANFVLSVFIGGIIGFFSGLIGIGGGIILSPVLLLLAWTDQKETATISALFIFVNSVSGLAGQLTQGVSLSAHIYFLVAIAVAGGFCGAYAGAFQFRQTMMKNILASVLVLASYKLLISNG